MVEAGQMKLSASDVRLVLSCPKKSASLCPKWQKEAVKLEVCPWTNPRKNLEERQVLVDKIQTIKEVLHASK